ncbi:molecular chaperone [Candidatus Falkowbacteria bacterium CG10_big_fil_rev_8_21_14_0_10_44_15]|uniref:Molecular chaperone n=1 Tax=Candidatus Falkowbacteria bacterium CG10_big_fil_rev_8_21_14_0_10_44_15 TaxID=1974569 RepID=A0A2H0UYN4_9BACT|nr:MAG: molecular chaperone [Candidatus Falkowbacteria bacterium CG10_big_fil_rev_8_21_14_0_10_44_15]
MDFFRKLTGLNQGKANINVNTAPAEKVADNQPEEQWLADDYEEGQLAIDVYQSKDAIIVKSTIAGVKPEDIDISINNDLLTIRGARKMDEQISAEDYFYQECYWGSFSRSIILPVEVKPDQIEATIENGVLTIFLPKAQTAKQIEVKIKE